MHFNVELHFSLKADRRKIYLLSKDNSALALNLALLGHDDSYLTFLYSLWRLTGVTRC